MVAGVTSDAENSPVRLEVRATGDAVHEVREERVTGNSSWGVWGGVELPPKTWVVKGLAGISGRTSTA